MTDIVFDNNGEPLGTFTDGVEWATVALASALGMKPDDFSWDAATEEYEGDVIAVMCNVLNVAFGDDWQNSLHPTGRVNAHDDKEDRG